MHNVLVTGGAGFIGSNAVDRLLAEGIHVTVYDNFSTGFEEFLEKARQNSRFRLVRGDVLDSSALQRAMQGCDGVWHFAANADVRFGLAHPGKDLEQNTLAVFQVLEAMRAQKARKLVFASTGSVYGECSIIPTPENAPFPVQTSLYGASKLAGEGIIQAYCEGFGFEAWIFRFVSILGPRYTHGHVIDFYRRLLAEPGRLSILGNGEQKKSYLHVEDCVRAILHAIRQPLRPQGEGALDIYNLGTDEFVRVRDSAQLICQALGVKPEIETEAGERGWVGDVPFIYLDTSRIRKTGWSPRYSIPQAIEETLQWLMRNPWILDRRSETP